MSTPTTLTLIGSAAVLLAYLHAQIATARQASKIRVRVVDRRPAPRERDPRL